MGPPALFHPGVNTPTTRKSKMAQSANGVEGHLIYSAILDTYLFRVYDPTGEFVDYDIAHSDLCVTINDPDAYFYCRGNDDVLDHAPATLGIEDV
jgi:hypothetical protein